MFFHVIHVYIYTRRCKIFPAVCPFPSSLGQCPCPSCTLRVCWTFPSEHPSWYRIICWHNYVSSVSASPDCKHHEAVAESVLLHATSPGSGAMPGVKQAPMLSMAPFGSEKMLPQTVRGTSFSKIFQDPLPFSDRIKNFSIHSFNNFWNEWLSLVLRILVLKSEGLVLILWSLLIAWWWPNILNFSVCPFPPRWGGAKPVSEQWCTD